MRNILTSKKGISPILATLLLIVIAVAAVIVTYAWVMTFTSSQTDKTVLDFENIRFHNVSTTDYVEVIIRNSGPSDAKIVGVYAGTSSTALAAQTSVSYTPNTAVVTAGSSLNVTITYNWTDGTRYHFKMATEAGQTFSWVEVA